MKKEKKFLQVILSLASLAVLSTAFTYTLNAENDELPLLYEKDIHSSLSGEESHEDNSDTDEKTELMYGDIDQNGICELTDLQMLSVYLLKGLTFTDVQKEAADVDANGIVDIADLAYYKQYVSKDRKLNKNLRFNVKMTLK